MVFFEDDFDLNNLFAKYSNSDGSPNFSLINISTIMPIRSDISITNSPDVMLPTMTILVWTTEQSSLDSAIPEDSSQHSDIPLDISSSLIPNLEILTRLPQSKTDLLDSQLVEAWLTDPNHDLMSNPSIQSGTDYVRITQSKSGIVKLNPCFALTVSVLFVQAPHQASDALHSLEWKQSMQCEIDALANKRTWILIDCAPSNNVIDSLWVFKVRQGSDMNVDKLKACLVANGV